MLVMLPVLVGSMSTGSDYYRGRFLVARQPLPALSRKSLESVRKLSPSSFVDFQPSRSIDSIRRSQLPFQHSAVCFRGALNRRSVIDKFPFHNSLINETAQTMSINEANLESPLKANWPKS